MNRERACHLHGTAWLTSFLILLCTMPGFGQQSSKGAAASDDNSLAQPIQELRQQVQELQAAVAEIRAESQRYRAETEELRRELQAVRGEGPKPEGRATVAQESRAGYSNATATPAADQGATQRSERHAASLQEEYDLLSGKVDEQYQTKVESASKYRVRLSGIVLLNLFGNRGTVDNIDYPSLAYERPDGAAQGSFGGTLRQSQIGLEVFGPEVAGAKTRADLQMDFAGGFARAPNAVNFGLVRLRTGTLHFDWAKTSVVGGQDGLFFSPESPTSFATLAEPALSYTGNLWAWTPQVRVEHRWSVGENSDVVVQGGILDPLNGESPPSGYYRQPGAGEASRQPAYATRVAWTYSLFGQPLRIGIAGYYSRQNYGFSRTVDGWAGITDWQMPLGRKVSLNGEMYRGSAIGGIGGGIGRSVLFSDNPALDTTLVRALNSVGGWAQLKYRPVPKLEFNGAFGEDNPFAGDVRAFPHAQSSGDPTLIRNQGSFANVIYRPRSDLLFSAEYRHLRTFNVFDQSYLADQVNLTMGVLF